MNLELVYFANPMCSWCYGFHAGFAAALGARTAAVTATVALGALREDTEPLRDEQKAYLRDAWARVAAMSGRPFDVALLERTDFVYDTRPASRAVAAVRAAMPAQTLAFLGAVQTAFYRDNRDVTQPAVLAEIAAEAGLAPAIVEAALADLETGDALAAENAEVARLGVTGYPTLLALTRPKPRVIALGFQPPAAVAAAIDEALRAAA
ncbi:MAG: DsbA family protein [Alphaproteobacteria bacterium]